MASSTECFQSNNNYSVTCCSKVSASIKYFLLHSSIPHVSNFKIILCPQFIQFRCLMSVANFSVYATQKHTDMHKEEMRLMQ